MLTAELDREYAHKEFFFRQRPQTGKQLFLPTLTQEPDKNVCYMLIRTRERERVVLPTLLKCLEELRDKLLSLMLVCGSKRFSLCFP